MLKAPGTKHLKLKYDEPLSTFAFKFKLRRFTLVGYSLGARVIQHAAAALDAAPDGAGRGLIQVGPGISCMLRHRHVFFHCRLLSTTASCDVANITTKCVKPLRHLV
jgi:hypothetical protein